MVSEAVCELLKAAVESLDGADGTLEAHDHVPGEVLGITEDDVVEARRVWLPLLALPSVATVTVGELSGEMDQRSAAFAKDAERSCNIRSSMLKGLSGH